MWCSAEWRVSDNYLLYGVITRLSAEWRVSDNYYGVITRVIALLLVPGHRCKLI